MIMHHFRFLVFVRVIKRAYMVLELNHSSSKYTNDLFNKNSAKFSINDGYYSWSYRSGII